MRRRGGKMQEIIEIAELQTAVFLGIGREEYFDLI